MQSPKETLILDGLDYQHSFRGHHLTITTHGEGGNRQEMKIDPNLVWGIYDADNHVVAAEVIDEHDRGVILQFETGEA